MAMSVLDALLEQCLVCGICCREGVGGGTTLVGSLFRNVLDRGGDVTVAGRCCVPERKLENLVEMVVCCAIRRVQHPANLVPPCNCLMTSCPGPQAVNMRAGVYTASIASTGQADTVRSGKG
jgi:hypothetical protein